jgi:CRP-like cAMP-binding protein
LRARGIGLIEDNRFEMPLSQSLLADSLGMTAVHLNRVLKRLRLEETLILKRGSLTITDPLKLAQIAGFDENYLHRRLRAAA